MADLAFAGEVFVRGNASGFVQEVQIGKHRLVVDEPVEHGGTDQGPNPCELVLAALGT